VGEAVEATGLLLVAVGEVTRTFAAASADTEPEPVRLVVAATTVGGRVPSGVAVIVCVPA
jgi:hypothetical protein